MNALEFLQMKCGGSYTGEDLFNNLTADEILEEMEKYAEYKKTRIYKFQDEVDGNNAFIIADSPEQATNVIEDQTSIHCILTASHPLENHLPIVWINRILPF